MPGPAGLAMQRADQVGRMSFGATSASQTQPTIKPTPPMGVTAPSQRAFVKASKYKEPEKTKIPARKLNHGPTCNGARLAIT